MAIPAMPAPQPGGDYVSAMSNVNALHDAMLKSKMQQMQNQVQQIKMPYVGPKEQEELRKAQLYNQYYGPEKQATIAHQNLVNQFYGPNIQSEMAFRGAQTNKLNTMTPLEAQQLRLANQFYPELTKSQIASQNAMANWRNMGGGGLGVAQKDLNSFTRQLMLENPQQPNEDQNAYNQRINQIQSAHLEGSDTLPDGTPIQPLSGTGQQLLTTITNRNAPVAVKNQAANMDVLVNDLKDFDIEAVQALAGPQGKAKLAYAKAQMATNPNNPNIDPMARRFLTAMNQSIVNMDSMRKAFGTSVVPDYVYKTIGELTNPSSSIWNDSKQVGQNYQKLIETMEKNRNLLMEKAKKGVTAGLPNKSEKNNKNKKLPSQMTDEEIRAELANLGK